MEQPTPADGSAEPDWQRHDVRSLHGLGVPATPTNETTTSGLTTAIQGTRDINADIS
jgi:hypothetical protein